MGFYNPVVTEEIRRKVAAMTLRELINHVCCPNFGATSPDPEEEYGAVFFHAQENLRERVRRYAERCGADPLAAADFEAGASGITGAVKFPSFHACTLHPNDELIRTAGEAAAMQGREAGFNWSFSPCVDVAVNPDNPIVGIRCGAAVETSLRAGRLYMEGLQQNGMAATLKHFPGDGFTTRDQHITTSDNPLTREQWMAVFGRIYRELGEAGAMSVMPGHITLPSFDEPDPVNRLYPPATLSYNLLTKLLKEKLGFQGIIVSDATEMGGFCNFINRYDGYARFLNAGGDCLLFTRMTERFYQNMEERVRSGMLTEKILADRAARMIAFRRDVAEMGRMVPVTSRVEQYRDAARKIARNAVSVVRDRCSLLPVKIANPRIAHVIIALDFDEDPSPYKRLTEGLKKYASHVVELVDIGPSELADRIENKEFDLVVCSFGNPSRWGTGSIRIDGPLARNMMQGWMRFGTPVVFVAHYNRNAQLEFDAAIDTLINSCGSTADSTKMILETIFGKKEIGI